MSGSKVVVFKRKISRRSKSLSSDLKRFVFKFITENVSSHKYVLNITQRWQRGRVVKASD